MNEKKNRSKLTCPIRIWFSSTRSLLSYMNFNNHGTASITIAALTVCMWSRMNSIKDCSKNKLNKRCLVDYLFCHLINSLYLKLWCKSIVIIISPSHKSVLKQFIIFKFWIKDNYSEYKFESNILFWLTHFRMPCKNFIVDQDF
jgi:hypothetical protein